MKHKDPARSKFDYFISNFIWKKAAYSLEACKTWLETKTPQPQPQPLPKHQKPRGAIIEWGESDGQQVNSQSTLSHYFDVGMLKGTSPRNIKIGTQVSPIYILVFYRTVSIIDLKLLPRAMWRWEWGCMEKGKPTDPSWQVRNLIGVVSQFLPNPSITLSL